MKGSLIIAVGLRYGCFLFLESEFKKTAGAE